MFPLYRDKAGVYFATLYKPMAGRLRGKGQDKASAELYSFKAYFAEADRHLLLLQAAAEFLDCDGVAAVPGAGLEMNSVQKLAGQLPGGPCARFVATAARPNRHNFKTKAFAAAGEAARTRLEILRRPRRLLLLDDIATTGKTLQVYKKLLAAAGAAEQVVPFVFGRTQCQFSKVGVVCLPDRPEPAPAPEPQDVAEITDPVAAAVQLVKEKIARKEKLTAADYKFLEEQQRAKGDAEGSDGTVALERFRAARARLAAAQAERAEFAARKERGELLTLESVADAVGQVGMVISEALTRFVENLPEEYRAEVEPQFDKLAADINAGLEGIVLRHPGAEVDRVA